MEAIIKCAEQMRLAQLGPNPGRTESAAQLQQRDLQSVLRARLSQRLRRRPSASTICVHLSQSAHAAFTVHHSPSMHFPTSHRMHASGHVFPSPGCGGASAEPLRHYCRCGGRPLLLLLPRPARYVHDIYYALVLCPRQMRDGAPAWICASTLPQFCIRTSHSCTHTAAYPAPVDYCPPTSCRRYCRRLLLPRHAAVHPSLVSLSLVCRLGLGCVFLRRFLWEQPLAFASCAPLQFFLVFATFVIISHLAICPIAYPGVIKSCAGCWLSCYTPHALCSAICPSLAPFTAFGYIESAPN